MKKIPTLALLFAVLVVLPACAPEGASQQAAEAPQSAVPALPSLADAAGAQAPLGTAPDFTLATLAGDSLRRSELQGKATLVNFWATWCGPCVEEIPELVDLYLELHPYGLEIVGISIDEEGQEIVAPFAARFNINYPVALDPDGKVAEAFGGVWALPTTYLIDAQGQIIERVVGLYPVQERRPALRTLLNAPQAMNTGQ